mgnify:CR=1 FL=1
MKTTAGSELSFHSTTYIHDNLSGLYLADIPLSVPTRNGSVLINSPELSDPQQILVQTKEFGADFVIARVDGSPLQVVEADDRRPTYGQELFVRPVPRLGLRCVDRYVWLTNVDTDAVNDMTMMHEFVGILSTFAGIKQAKLTQ